MPRMSGARMLRASGLLAETRSPSGGSEIRPRSARRREASHQCADWRAQKSSRRNAHGHPGPRAWRAWQIHPRRSSVLNPRSPVLRPPRMMCDREDDDTLGIVPVDQCVGEVLQEQSSYLSRNRRTRVRECNRTGRGFLDGSDEPRPKARLLVAVVGDRQEQFPACRSNEPCAVYRDMRRASAKTSSAAWAGISPRSNAAIRSSISCAQAASISARGECREASIDSASRARSSAPKVLRRALIKPLGYTFVHEMPA